MKRSHQKRGSQKPTAEPMEEELFVRHERYRRITRLIRDGRHIRDISRMEHIPEQVLRDMMEIE